MITDPVQQNESKFEATENLETTVARPQIAKKSDGKTGLSNAPIGLYVPFHQ